MDKRDPAKPRDKMLSTHSLCKIAGVEHKKIFQQTSQFLRNDQRGGRPGLLETRENLKTWQRPTRLIIKEKYKPISFIGETK